MNAQQAYILSKAFTKETADEFGALKGAPCTVKSIVHQNGINTVTFEWKNSSGETRESEMSVYDGTPIYVWESGNTYKYGDLAIYASCFYRCITENSDVEFDATKWNEIGSPDGNYDIVENSSLLPAIFTAADRKIYFSIYDSNYWLWDGEKWTEQKTLHQYSSMPTPSEQYLGCIIQYIGTDDYLQGFFYKCVEKSEGEYAWESIDPIESLTSDQMVDLLAILN